MDPRTVINMPLSSNPIPKVKNQRDATKYIVLLPQHVSGTHS
jgi:hypothetical protein